MAATLVHNYAETAVMMAEADLRRDGVLSQPSAGLLALFNVSRILCSTSLANGCPDRIATQGPEGPLGRTVRVPNATPVLFSRCLTPTPMHPEFDKPMLWSDAFVPDTPMVTSLAAYLRRYIDQVNPDWAAREAACLPVSDVPPGQPGASGPGPWHPRLDDYAVSLDKVTMVVTTDGPGYAQLAHPWFPGNVVRVNGTAVAPLEGALHLVVVPLQPGTSRIEITPFVTPVRMLALGISAAAAAATVLIALGGGLARWVRSARLRGGLESRGA